MDLEIIVSIPMHKIVTRSYSTLGLVISLNELFQLVYFLIPAYIANAVPVLFGGGLPLDLGKNFVNGERIFGINKTVKGFLCGFLLGSVTSLIEEFILMKELILLGVLASLGSMLGDLFGSFIKRRLKMRPGSSLLLIDQLDFIIGAIILSYPVYRFSYSMLLIIIMVTPPIHILANTIAYLLKLKRNYW